MVTSYSSNKVCTTLLAALLRYGTTWTRRVLANRLAFRAMRWADIQPVSVDGQWPLISEDVHQWVQIRNNISILDLSSNEYQLRKKVDFWSCFAQLIVACWNAR